MLFLFAFPLIVSVEKSTEKKAERLTVDGRQFTINQKNFKPAKFSLYGREFDDTYGFVSPDYLPLDNRGYAEVIEQCKFEDNSMPLHEYSPLGTFNYYPDTPHFDAWKGYDLVPENKHNYVPGTEFEAYFNFKDGKKYVDKTIMMDQCRLPQDDGGAWHVQRVGPMISTGGYDWWQIAWPDVGMLEEAIKKYPKGIDVIKEIFVPVLKDGTRLNYPPIHTHHFHLNGPNGVRPRMNTRPLCVHKLGLGIDSLDEMIRERNCYNLSLFFEQHGDYICQPEDDGLDCLTQGDKNPRRLVRSIDIEGELNDVRPFDSEPLEWYYLVALRWKPADFTQDPISQSFLLGPGFMLPPSQLSKSATYPAPTNAQSVMTYTSKLQISGQLIRMKLHGHSGIFESSIVLRGVPSDFGIGGSKFIPPKSCNTIVTTELGFRDNDDLGEHILYHLKKSQETYDAECLGDKAASGYHLRNPICLRPRPELICVAAVDVALVDFKGQEFAFDRRSKTWCQPLTFKQGEDFTVVGFNKHVIKPPAPAYPDTIPKYMSQHLALIMSYNQTGSGHSQFDTMISGHDGPFYFFQEKLSPPMLLARTVAVVFWNSPPIYSDTLLVLEWFFAAVFTAITGAILHFTFGGLRKISAFDNCVKAVTGNVLLFFTVSAKAAAEATVGANKGHKYEMVRLMDDEDLADDGEEEVNKHSL